MQKIPSLSRYFSISIAVLIPLITLFITSCNSTETGDKLFVPRKNCVEVIYLHGKKRCAGCEAIEKNTSLAISENFASEVSDSTILLKLLSIDENPNLSKKYEVAFSSLLVIRWKDGKDSVINLTDFGFAKARTAPDLFKDSIKNIITPLIK